MNEKPRLLDLDLAARRCAFAEIHASNPTPQRMEEIREDLRVAISEIRRYRAAWWEIEEVVKRVDRVHAEWQRNLADVFDLIKCNRMLDELLHAKIAELGGIDVK